MYNHASLLYLDSKIVPFWFGFNEFHINLVSAATLITMSKNDGDSQGELSIRFFSDHAVFCGTGRMCFLRLDVLQGK